ncbi:MAG: tetratricopeptide repeat protein [Deltaproteobacteria bacterium]|nr:tetratricopeptide repeat protein [Deltaproteobacteria bacterium]MCW5804024.1 tetratricopeptide repeat protein [Deltaproteobacteria bacterium]
MGKRRREDAARQEGDALDRAFARLEEAPAGLHDLEPPAARLPPGLPEGLIELYARCDGGRLFLDTIELVRSTEITMPVAGRWRFGTIDGDPLSIDHRGKIWRFDANLEDELCDGTRLDRWLAGVIEATELFYDADGEFAEDVFDDEGEIEPRVREKSLRAQIKRDAAAPGPRWRLAQALADQGAIEDARNELEQVVSDDPAFAWAWLDLARISEKLGDLGNATDEIRMAAETADGTQHPQAGYFWAQLARLAVRTGDDLLRAEAATRASLIAPDLRRAQLDGATASLAAGDVVSARGLIELLRAVWPRDLEVLDLARRVEGN